MTSTILKLVVLCVFLTSLNVRCEDSDEEVQNEDEQTESGLDSQGIYDFMISTKALSTIAFHGSDLIIHEHPNNAPDDKMHPDNRFYVMPVVEIDATSLEVRHSWIIDAYRLDFMLILWTDDLKNAAIEDLERLYAVFDEVSGQPKHLTMNQIQMIPMEEVRLIWNSELPLPDGIWLSRDWIPFSRNPHQLRFSFLCEEEDVCQKLKTEMEEHPGEFRKLNLEFTTTVKSGASREIQITGSTLTTSKIFHDLLSDDKYPGGEEGIRYLTAEDLQTLSLEVTENYVATVTTDAEYVPTQDSLSVAELIFNRLASTKESTSFMSEKAWSSLKWEPDFARPDKVTKQLNDITNVVTAQNGTKYLKINDTAFNNANYNFAYAHDFNQMRNYHYNTGNSQTDTDSCDSSKSSTYGSLKVGWGLFGGRASGSHHRQTHSCNSLFNAKSWRSTNDIRGATSGTNLDKTDVETAGLSNWQVSKDTFNDYLRDQSSYIEFNGEKFVHKPMDLYKMVMADLTENVNIATTDMQVQKLQKIYHIKVTISSEVTNPYQSEIDMVKMSIKDLARNYTQDLLQLERDQKQELTKVRQEHIDDIEAVKYVLISEHNTLKAIQESMHLNLSTSIGALTDMHHEFKYDVSDEIAILQNFTKRLGPGDISFLATSTVTQYVSTSDNAIFNKVEINWGDGYDAFSGKFTSPTDGLYLFYFGLHLNTNDKTVYMYVDNSLKFSARDYKVYPSGTFMVQLNKGQTVYMKFSYSLNVYGDTYTWFGGHLIRQL